MNYLARLNIFKTGKWGVNLHDINIWSQPHAVEWHFNANTDDREAQTLEHHMIACIDMGYFSIIHSATLNLLITLTFLFTKSIRHTILGPICQNIFIAVYWYVIVCTICIYIISSFMSCHCHWSDIHVNDHYCTAKCAKTIVIQYVK